MGVREMFNFPSGKNFTAFTSDLHTSHIFNSFVKRYLRDSRNRLLWPNFRAFTLDMHSCHICQQFCETILA